MKSVPILIAIPAAITIPTPVMVAIIVAAAVVTPIEMTMVPMTGPGVSHMPPAPALIMPMNPPAPMAVTGNPNPLVPVVPVMRAVEIPPVSDTDREIERAGRGCERGTRCQD